MTPCDDKDGVMRIFKISSGVNSARVCSEKCFEKTSCTHFIYDSASKSCSGFDSDFDCTTHATGWKYKMMRACTWNFPSEVEPSISPFTCTHKAEFKNYAANKRIQASCETAVSQFDCETKTSATKFLTTYRMLKVGRMSW